MPRLMQQAQMLKVDWLTISFSTVSASSKSRSSSALQGVGEGEMAAVGVGRQQQSGRAAGAAAPPQNPGPVDPCGWKDIWSSNSAAAASKPPADQEGWAAHRSCSIVSKLVHVGLLQVRSPDSSQQQQQTKQLTAAAAACQSQ